MGMRGRRRFRLPVVSRLTLAWSAFALAAAAFTVYSAMEGGKRRSALRVALEVSPEIETMARSSGRRTGASEAQSAPALRDGAARAEPFFAEGEDVLESEPLQSDPYSEEPLEALAPEDIVITIDGAPAPAPGAKAVSAGLASYAAPTLTIPDPEPSLLQKNAFGYIPRIAADGRRASHFYARPFEGGDGPRVALIVGGLGLNPALTERAIEELPAEVTLAFAPYAKDLAYWTQRAREAGHEIMVELPMEGHGGSIETLGPAALLTGRAPADNLQRLDWLLARFGGYFGVTNYLGGKFSADSEAMGAVLARLDSLGLAYIDDTGAARRAGAGRRISVVNRMIAAGSGDAGAARRDLEALEKIAVRDGEALGKAYAYDATLNVIGEWTRQLEKRKLSLAPASAVLRSDGAGG